MQLFKF